MSRVLKGPYPYVALTVPNGQGLKYARRRIRRPYSAQGLSWQAGATSGGFPQNRRQKTTTATLRQTSDHIMYQGRQDSAAKRLSYGGFYMAANTDTALGNDYVLKAEIHWNGIIVPVTWSGSASVTVTTGTPKVTCDPVYPAAFGVASFPRGIEFKVRTEATLSTTNLFLPGNWRSMRIDGVLVPNEKIIQSDSSVSQLGVLGDLIGADTNDFGLVPFMVEDRFLSPEVSCLIIGDSIVTFTGDGGDLVSQWGDGRYPTGGWLSMLFYSTGGVQGRIPWVKASQGSTRANQYNPGHSMRLTYYGAFTHAIVAYDTNGISALAGTDYVVAAATIRAGLQTIYNELKTIQGPYGKPMHVTQVCVLPKANTNNNGIDAAGQSPVIKFQANQTMPLVNAGFVAGQNNIDEVFLLSAVIDPNDPLKWKSNNTVQAFAFETGTNALLTHPSASGAALIAGQADLRTAIQAWAT